MLSFEYDFLRARWSACREGRNEGGGRGKRGWKGGKTRAGRLRTAAEGRTQKAITGLKATNETGISFGAQWRKSARDAAVYQKMSLIPILGSS